MCFIIILHEFMFDESNSIIINLNQKIEIISSFQLEQKEYYMCIQFKILLEGYLVFFLIKLG